MDIRVLSQGGQNTEDIVLRQMDNKILSNSQSDYNGASNDNNGNGNVRDINEADVEKSVEKLNKLFEDKTTHAEYEVYGKSQKITVKIVDDNTKEVVRELPPKKLIDMMDKLCELAGLFMDEKA